MAMTKEGFYKVWKDSSREEILNQYYYDREELQERLNKVQDKLKEKEKYDNLQQRIDKAKSYLEYDINGMKASIRTWEKVKEETEIDTDYITNMLEREKRNYERILKILKGE